jgi:hypothetical protein
MYFFESIDIYSNYQQMVQKGDTIGGENKGGKKEELEADSVEELKEQLGVIVGRIDILRKNLAEGGIDKQKLAWNAQLARLEEQEALLEVDIKTVKQMDVKIEVEAEKEHNHSEIITDPPSTKHKMKLAGVDKRLTKAEILKAAAVEKAEIRKIAVQPKGNPSISCFSCFVVAE